MSEYITTAPEQTGRGLGFFERYLSVWVALCITAGVALGQLLPALPETLSQLTYAQVNIPIAILIWFMIYPMMVQIDFSSILDVRR
jgi:arsenite transporter